MLLPSKSLNLDLCPSKLLYPRSFTSDVVSTAQSFKSWNTCMDNKTCKIIAIVGIVLAVIVVVWIIGGLAHCFISGVSGIAECLCCCCRICGNNSRRNNQLGYQREMSDISKPSAYDNPHMYPPKPAPVYDNTAWNQGGYRPVPQQQQQQFHYGPGVVSDEDKYDYHNSNSYGYKANSNYR